MPSPIEFLKSFFSPETVEKVSAPVGAWIPPAATATTPNIAFEKGRPVMDAALAHTHNESMFTGMLSWGPLVGLAMIAMAFVWTRFLKG